MKIFRKIAAVVSAAVIAVSACASMALTAAADSIEDTAQTISSGKQYSQVMTTGYRNDHYGTFADYKIVTDKSGKISLSLISTTDYIGVVLYDKDFNRVSVSYYNITTGSSYMGTDWLGRKYARYEANSVAEKSNTVTEWEVSKGVYYLRIYNDMDWTYGYRGSSGKITFTATFPGATESTAKINYLTINLKKGDTLSLGASVSGSGTVKWSSSKPTVAAVSSSGKVTAKKAGSAIITAKVGSSSQKIKIVVS